MLEKALQQHSSSQHQGTTSMAAQPMHLMHTPGTHQYSCTMMEEKNTPRVSCMISLMFLFDHHFFSFQANEFVSLAASYFIQD